MYLATVDVIAHAQVGKKQDPLASRIVVEGVRAPFVVGAIDHLVHLVDRLV